MWRERRDRGPNDAGIPVHVRSTGSGRWRRGRALRVHDALAVRLAHGAGRDDPLWVANARERPPTTDERWWIHRMGGDLVVGTGALRDGGSIDIAVRRSHGPALFGEATRQQAA